VDRRPAPARPKGNRTLNYNIKHLEL